MFIPMIPFIWKNDATNAKWYGSEIAVNTVKGKNEIRFYLCLLFCPSCYLVRDIFMCCRGWMLSFTVTIYMPAGRAERSIL